jgi:gluconolactonase
MDNARVLATGLRFPEAPVWMEDGSVILVEIERQCITRVTANGTVSVIATPGGGPNGLAIGPDGALYCCNNGGFMWQQQQGYLRPVGPAADYVTGRIERIDPNTGDVRVLYDRCGDHKLLGPNDIVFDHQGGFYFTDLGKARARDRDWGSHPTASASRPTTRCCMSPRPRPAGFGRSTSPHPA